MKHQIPVFLIFSRIVIGTLIILLASIHINNYRFLAITLLTVGLLTDIFDGIIARQLNISTQKLRRLDSGADQFFFISVVVSTYIQCPVFFKANALKLIILASFEGVTYLISFIKFKKEIATHSIGAKIWTLLLFSTLVQIIWTCNSILLFLVCFWMGIITRVEIMAIIFTLRKWTNDVPTIYHACQLRRNKDIKRNKLFNG
jgi:CDP-diacylglycerol--glycerol-3-phosphate 3-phosphatidyltransferase